MVFEAFKRMRGEHPDAPAFMITSGDRSVPITWRQFTDDIDLVVNIIREHAKGEKIGILGENSYEWVVAHAAILFSGATVIPIDMNLNPVEIADRLRFVGATALIHSSLYDDKAREAGKMMPGVITAGFGSLKTERFLDKIRGMLKPKNSIWNEESVDVKRTSMIVFTSGTTSVPRGAELTIEGLETFCEYAQMQLCIRPGTRSLMLLPLHHIFGICTTYLMLMQGSALGVCPDFRRIYDAAERFRVNYLFLVPALADILAAKIDQHGKSAEEALGTPIDWILTGGAACPRRTYEHLTALGVKMITGSGMTETTAHFSITPIEGDPHVGSQGLTPRNFRTETKVAENGELLIRGPAVMKGYYKEPEKTAAVIDREGWYHTGDIGTIDDEGFVYFTGRASRTIILDSGKKIAPEELEDKILSIPGIRECVVRGEKDTRDIIAEVFAAIPECRVRKAVGELNLQLPVYKRIKTVVVRDEPFPRTSSGKIRL